MVSEQGRKHISEGVTAAWARRKATATIPTQKAATPASDSILDNLVAAAKGGPQFCEASIKLAYVLGKIDTMEERIGALLTKAKEQ